jgi:PEP-CTERM motif
VFKGNIVASINLSAMETDPGINPFCWEAQKSGACGASTSPVTATYSNGYTTLTFSGPTLPENMSNIPGQTSYHLGLDPSASNGSGPSLQLVKKYWTFSATKTPLPVVSMNGPPLDTGAIKYEVLFVNVTQSGVTGGDWFEVPYTGSTPPMLTPTNYSGAPETISNAGFTLSPTLIPLDSLNFNDYPPTGQSDSPFTAAPDLDGVLNSPPVPEPSTWALMLAGFASLGYAAHRALRKRRALAAQC